jgi:DNA-directed RNA polymerase subunit L
MSKKNIDIKIVQLHKQEFKDLESSQLVLEFSGSTVNSSLVNAFRRLALDYIPIYAFCPECIQIEKNTSIFNNDYMKLRMSLITLPQIHNKIAVLEDKYWKNVNYLDPNREKHPDDKKVLELYINANNTTTDVMNITTNNAKVYEDGVELDDKFDKNYPHLIIQLRPGEIFNAKINASLGIGKNNIIWAAARNSYYDEINPHHYKLTIESQGQMDEYEILFKACKVMKEKLNHVTHVITDQYDKPEIREQTLLNLVLNNEDHTLGIVLNEYLQLDDNIKYSGLSKPDLLMDVIKIKFESITKDPLKTLFKVINFIITIYDRLEEQLKMMGKKYIQ